MVTIICILPHNAFRINHLLLFHCKKVLCQTYAVESPHMIEGVADTVLRHQLTF